MQIPWETLRARTEHLAQQLSGSLDNQQRLLFQKEHAFLSTLLKKHDEIDGIEVALSATQEQLKQNTDAEMAPLFQEEIARLTSELQRAEKELEAWLYPPDPLDDRSIFLEIRAGTGGQEAALFASDLMTMYISYAERKGWKVSVIDISETDLNGFREVVLHIQGKNVYGHLKYESGVHRVQRVPKTETSGRIHTSTATVAVLPEAQEVEFSIAPQDLRIDTYRAGGKGGQHVNKTDSAVRITHLPTGLVVACQEERSQHSNKDKAMKVLKSRLFALQKEKQAEERSKQRREQVGTGERAEKVRTYNFPQNRVTDHQVEMTLKSLDRFMEGEVDEIVEALREKDRVTRRSQALQFNL